LKVTATNMNGTRQAASVGDQMHWLTTKLGRQRVTEHFATAEDDQSSTPL